MKNDFYPAHSNSAGKASVGEATGWQSREYWQKMADWAERQRLRAVAAEKAVKKTGGTKMVAGVGGSRFWTIEVARYKRLAEEK